MGNVVAEQWLETAHAAAAAIAERHGAEWRPWSADDLDGSRVPACVAFNAALEEVEDDDEQRGTLLDYWRAALAALLREKRGGKRIEKRKDGWYLDGQRLQDGDALRLMLADGGQILGGYFWENGPRFRFTVSRTAEDVLALGGEEEFAIEPACPRTTPVPYTSRLRVVHEGGGLRHYLGRRDVHAGYGLELWADGMRIAGRYEWSFREEDEPTLHFRLAGGLAGLSRVIRLPHDAELVMEGDRA